MRFVNQYTTQPDPMNNDDICRFVSLLCGIMELSPRTKGIVFRGPTLGEASKMMIRFKQNKEMWRRYRASRTIVEGR